MIYALDNLCLKALGFLLTPGPFLVGCRPLKSESTLFQYKFEYVVKYHNNETITSDLLC